MEGVQKIDGGRIGAHRWRAVYVHFVCGNSWQFRRSILVVDSFSRIRFPIINKNLINLRSMHRVSWQVPDLITPKQRSPDKTPVDRASCMGRMRFPPPLLEFIYLFTYFLFFFWIWYTRQQLSFPAHISSGRNGRHCALIDVDKRRFGGCSRYLGPVIS